MIACAGLLLFAAYCAAAAAADVRLLLLANDSLPKARAFWAAHDSLPRTDIGGGIYAVDCPAPCEQLDAFRWDSEALQSADDRVGLLKFVQPAFYFLAGLLFVSWLARALANLPPLHGGAPVSWTERVLWYVPFANWIAMLRSLRRVWRASEPRVGTAEPAVPAYLTALWGAWLVVRVLWPVGLIWAFAAGLASVFGTVQPTKGLVTYAAFLAIVDCASGTAAVLAVPAVIALERRQAGRARSLAAVGARG